MNKIPNIKSFSEHGASINEHIERVILNEGATDASKEMEYVLVDAAGGPRHKKVYNHVKPYAIKKFPKAKFNVANSLGAKATHRLLEQCASIN